MFTAVSRAVNTGSMDHCPREHSPRTPVSKMTPVLETLVNMKFYNVMYKVFKNNSIPLYSNHIRPILVVEVHVVQRHLSQQYFRIPAWCCLQVKLCDPCLSTLSVPWCKRRYINTLPFLSFLTTNPSALHSPSTFLSLRLANITSPAVDATVLR